MTSQGDGFAAAFSTKKAESYYLGLRIKNFAEGTFLKKIKAREAKKLRLH